MRITFPALAPLDLYAIAMMASAIALGWLAYRHPNRILVFIATTVIATAAATVLFAGELVFPLLYYISRRLPKWHIGAGLLIAMVVTPPILYWRMPWPSQLPAGNVIHGTAGVAELRTVRHIGGGHRRSLQDLRLPFQVATMQFVPPGSQRLVAVTDTVDSGSVPGLAKRANVAIIYAPGQEGTARIAGAARTYSANLWWYVIETAYGATFAVAVLLGLVGIIRPRRPKRALSAPAASARPNEGVLRRFGR
jgi:hypothetical protein